jgi:hypothetical protein
MKHQRLQRKLRILLEAAAGQMGVVECEVAFRALADFDLRVADVAYVNRER